MQRPATLKLFDVIDVAIVGCFSCHDHGVELRVSSIQRLSKDLYGWVYKRFAAPSVEENA